MVWLRDWLPLISALLVVSALYSHYLGHSVLLYEIILVASGVILMLLCMLLPGRPRRAPEERGLITKFLSRALTDEQCSVIIPLFGFGLLVTWSVWKIFVKGSTNLRMEDFIVTLFALSLVLYHSGPSRFQREKDFVVLYLMFLTIVFVAIWKLYALLAGESFWELNQITGFHLITQPTVFIVNLLGVQANAELNLSGIGLSNIIEFEYEGRLLRAGIATSCSGFYSAGLFFSAFLAFLLVRYAHIDLPMIVAMIAGFGVTWASNIVRMVATVMAGALYGAPAFILFHTYFGILLFVLVIIFFWILVVRWLEKVENKREETQEQAPADSSSCEPDVTTDTNLSDGEAERSNLRQDSWDDQHGSD